MPEVAHATYLRAMWLMAQQHQPDDFAIATANAHSVREFAKLAFGFARLNPKDYVVVDPKLFRPKDLTRLLGDASKARRKLGWQHCVALGEIVHEMAEQDVEVWSRNSDLQNGQVG